MTDWLESAYLRIDCVAHLRARGINKSTCIQIYPRFYDILPIKSQDLIPNLNKMDTVQLMQSLVSHRVPPVVGLVALALIVFYYTGKVIHRLYFHPLSRFPGPRIAAATHLYEAYWDYCRKGQYLFEIERMHQKYGEYCFTIGSFQLLTED